MVLALNGVVTLFTNPRIERCMTSMTARQTMEALFERLADPNRRTEAHALFADEATIVRPGERFEGPDAASRYVAAGGSKYNAIAKDIDRWIETEREAASIGTLYGETADGNSFEGVRYIDVGGVENGKLVRLEIWNDLLADGIF